MDIPLSSDALDLSFHPGQQENLVAVGLISGKIQLVDYTDYLEHISSHSSSSLKPSGSGSGNDSRRAGKKVKTSSTGRTSGSIRNGRSTQQSTSNVDQDHDDDDSFRLAEQDLVKRYKKLWHTKPSKKSCRGLHFSTTGDSIWSISKDKSLFRVDVSTGKVVDSWVGVHSSAPSRVLPIDENTIITGDDDGVVRVWDPRKPNNKGKGAAGAVREYDHHFDWITDMLYIPFLPDKKKSILEQQAKKDNKAKSKNQRKKERKRKRKLDAERVQAEDENGDDSEEDEDDDSDAEGPFGAAGVPSSGGGTSGRSRLIVTSGDGSLSSIDFRMSGPSAFEVSEDQEDELLSVAVIKHSSKLVVGTQLGILSLWAPNKGLLDHVDRVPGHPASVDCLVTLDEDTVLTGSSDGLVRVVQILPNKLLGVITDHGGGLPVERMKRKNQVLGTIGHSNEVKFTDLSALLDDNDDDDDEDNEEEASDDDDDDDGKGLPLGVIGVGDGTDDDEDSEDDDEDEDVTDAAPRYDDEEDDDDDDDDSDSDSVRDGDANEDSEEEDSSDADDARAQKASRKTKNSWSDQALARAKAKGADSSQDDTAFFADL